MIRQNNKSDQTNGQFKTIVLIHENEIQQYRVAIYNYLYDHLMKYNYLLEVIAGGIEHTPSQKISFNYSQVPQNYFAIKKAIDRIHPEVIIYFVNLRSLYLFPILFYAKLKKIRLVYWGHGINLKKKKSLLNWAYSLEHKLSDAILLYANHLKRFVKKKYHKKIFVANNTLNTREYDLIGFDKDTVLKRYGIHTSKNIICVGRMQRRKRIFDLVEAYKRINMDNLGLILVGPDTDGILDNIEGESIYKIGPLYGNEKIALLKSSDIFCLPGALGLSIIDAFYCGLPVVTTDVDGHGPEIAYLDDSVNGFIVPQEDINALVEKLQLMLINDNLKAIFSKNARGIISGEANIETMCAGFRKAIKFVL